MIEIKNLSIGYAEKGNTKTLSQGLNAKIKSGKLTCLIGKNGVGKSTLLHTLCGLIPKLEGDIFIEEKKLETYTNAALAHKISIVLTEKANVKNLTAKELIAMGRSPYTGFWGALSKEDNIIINQAIELIGIAHLAHRMIDTLSDGERQKVMIAKALAQQTPIIFLDEPTSFLDFPSKVELLKLLQSLCRNNHKTIFFSSHDIELALQTADEIWLMTPNNGIQIGSPHDLFSNNALSRFLGNDNISFSDDNGKIRINFIP